MFDWVPNTLLFGENVSRKISIQRSTKNEASQIWSHLLKKSWMENFIFCAVSQIWSHLLKKSWMENFIFCAVYFGFWLLRIILKLKTKKQENMEAFSKLKKIQKLVTLKTWLNFIYAYWTHDLNWIIKTESCVRFMCVHKDFQSPVVCPVRSLSMGKKCPYSELFWSAFFRIRTE